MKYNHKATKPRARTNPLGPVISGNASTPVPTVVPAIRAALPTARFVRVFPRSRWIAIQRSQLCSGQIIGSRIFFHPFARRMVPLFSFDNTARRRNGKGERVRATQTRALAYLCAFVRVFSTDKWPCLGLFKGQKRKESVRCGY